MSGQSCWAKIGIFALALLAVRSASAQADEFIDNWSGDVKVSVPVLTGNIKPPPPGLLRGFADFAWSNLDLCAAVRAIVPKVAELKPGAAVKVCNKTDTANGDLLGEPVGPNRVAVRYVAPNNFVSVDLPDTPVPLQTTTITVTFDVVVDFEASVQFSVDGSVSPQDLAYVTTPLSLSPLAGHPANVRISNNVDPGNQAKLKNVVMAQRFSGDSIWLGIATGFFNKMVHDDASSEYTVLVTDSPGVSAFFSLQAFIATPQQDPQQPLVLQFGKDGVVDLPVNCLHSVGCNDTVIFVCADMAPGAFMLQRRLINQNWWTVSIDTSVPRFVFPQTSEINVDGTDNDTYRVCRPNQTRDLFCTEPVVVALPHTKCSVDPGFPRHCGGRGQPKCPTTHDPGS